ncbi:MAG: hypothetical protein C4539_01570 [Ignavibacteriales bacterium]|nr:MAG: hypothetical protein C4539_01570 [Ignavibacteriales bacterium]
MKKSIVISIVLVSLFATTGLFAQGKIYKGIYKLGGNIMFTSSNYETDFSKSTHTGFIFTPSLSYLITNNLEIGGNIGFKYEEMKSEPKNTQYGHTSKFIDRNFGIGPMIRYYFNAGNFYPFIGGSYYYSTNKLSGDNKSEDRTYAVFIGAEIFLSSGVAVEPLAKYGITNYSQGDEWKSFSFGVGINYFIVD